MNKYPKKYSNKKSENNPQFNLSEHKKKAIEDHDEERLVIIQRLENEIEKLLIIKKVREDQRLLNIYKNDINNVMQEGSYNLIEKILLREIELLEVGDFEAIAMLDKLKNLAQNKINELSRIALQSHQNQIKFNQEAPLPLQQIFVSKPVEPYKTYTQYEGFHLEKTMGGEFIQTLDADIKNLVGSDIVNSKPEQLSQNIIAEIKNIRQGNLDIAPENNNSSTNANNVSNLNNNSSIIKKSIKDSSANDINNYPSKSSVDLNRNVKGEWTDLITNQEKQKSQEVGIETGGQSHKK